MAETLSLISIIAFAVAAICLVVTIIIFVRFKIPSVIGDLSGRNARKSIEQMREINEQSGKKSYKPSKINAERGKLTETMQGKRNEGSEQPKTGLLDENRVKTITETETTLLIDEETTELLIDDNETAELEECEKSIYGCTGGIPIEMIEEIMFVHTQEIV